MVFLFHSRIHINVNYKILNNFIGTGHIFMVAFFMLSGFSLFYVDSQKGKFDETTEYKNIGKFLKRRILNLFPLYIFIYAIFIIEQFIKVHLLGQTVNGHLGIIDNIIAAPIELSMLQSVLIGSFPLLHNGGTWFISCIFICYIFYPYVVQNVNNNSFKYNILLLTLLYCVSSYAILPVWKFSFASIYANPLLRLVEFSIGVIIGKFFLDNNNKYIAKQFWLIVFVCYIILCFIITLGVHYISGEVELYNFIAIPSFASILYFSARLEKKYKVQHFKKIITTLSENTYANYEYGGKYKTENNVIMEIDNSGNRKVRFRPVEANETENAMEQLELAFLDAYNDSNVNQLLLIPCVILDFLCIHPFRDGNGRMSRLLLLLLLYKNGFDVGKYISFEEQINKNKTQYYDSLKISSENWHENKNNYIPFMQNFIITLYQCYQELDKRFAVVNSSKITKNSRIEATVLNSILPISKSEICKILPDVSPSTIEAVLGKMVKSQTIKIIGNGRGARYVRK